MCTPPQGSREVCQRKQWVIFYAKQKADRHWEECENRCCCQVQPGTALGPSVGVIGKGPFVFARRGKEQLEILSGGGRAQDS